MKTPSLIYEKKKKKEKKKKHSLIYKQICIELKNSKEILEWNCCALKIREWMFMRNWICKFKCLHVGKGCFRIAEFILNFRVAYKGKWRERKERKGKRKEGEWRVRERKSKGK